MQSSSNPRQARHGTALLQLARQSIEHGLVTGTPMPVQLANYHSELQQPGAAFVTLQKEHRLRGCIGNLDAYQPLVNEVADNAFNAAFRDPRFPAVESAELETLKIELSVLSPHEPLHVSSEPELINALQPHIDGILLEEGCYRATFLPTVWEQLPDKLEFLQQLKLKAGLPADYWSKTLRISRYDTICYME